MTTQFATTGAAQGTGDGSTEANRIELKKAIDDDAGLAVALAAGDVIACKDDGELTYDGSAGAFVTLSVTGTVNAAITIDGYTTTPGDGGRIAIRDTNAGATNNFMQFSTIDHWAFRNMDVLDCRVGFNMGVRAGFYFENVIVRNNISTAFNRATATVNGCSYVQCHVFNGVSGFVDNGRGSKWVNCSAINLVGIGFEHKPGVHPGSFTNCLAHSCTGSGFVTNGGVTFINCTSNRNGGDGFEWLSTQTPNVMVNCAATTNTGDALGSLSAITVHAINCAFVATNELNTAGETDANVTVLKIGEVTADPVYVDPNPTPETDVNLTVGNAWRAAGVGLHALNLTKSFIDLGVAQQQADADTLVIRKIRRNF